MSLLYRTLTNVPNAFPATEPIKYLIGSIGHKIVAFRRCNQVSYLLLSRARDICNDINVIINNFDEDETWESYDKAMDAIAVLKAYEVFLSLYPRH